MPRARQLAGLLVTVAALTFIGRAAGQEPPAPAATLPTSDESPAAEPPAPSNAELARRLERLEADNVRLSAALRKLNTQRQSLEKRIDHAVSLATRVGGYLDFGFFYATGDGRGIRTDLGYKHFPEFRDVVPDSWVFMGDPLSTAINSRGEPSSTNESRAVTFNAINNGGKASFIANSLTLSLFVGLGDNLTFTGMVDLVPRGRDVSTAGTALGDFLDVKLAYIEYIVPVKRFALSLFVGKFDSVLGIEYRSQDAPDRLAVTPSLICRYTCGRPLGIKARVRFANDRLVLALAVINGTSFTEYFPFYNEIDVNFFKTLAARVSYKIPLGAGLEIGASGAVGAQDNQTSDSVLQWHYGLDLHLEWRDFELSGEFVQGRANGATAVGEPDCGTTQCLRYMGAYGLVAYRILNWLTPYVRVDWRDALHQNGASFVYISQLMRVTGGVHVEIGASIIIKAEFTYVLELGRVPDFDDNVLTSSMVVRF